MLVFRRELLLNDPDISIDVTEMGWSKDIDGQVATFRDENAHLGTCGIQSYVVHRCWCEEVADK